MFDVRLQSRCRGNVWYIDQYRPHGLNRSLCSPGAATNHENSGASAAQIRAYVLMDLGMQNRTPQTVATALSGLFGVPVTPEEDEAFACTFDDIDEAQAYSLDAVGEDASEDEQEQRDAMAAEYHEPQVRAAGVALRLAARDAHWLLGYLAPNLDSDRAEMARRYAENLHNAIEAHYNAMDGDK